MSEILTYAETAERLAVTEKTVRNLVQSGELQPVGAWPMRFRADDLPGGGRQLVKLKDAARRLRYCAATIRRHCDAGDFPGVKVGRQWRVAVDDLP